MFEFHRADELIALGREAIRRAAAEIREHVELNRTDASGAVASGGPVKLSGRDIFAQSLALAVERVDVALDDVADGDDADQAAVLRRSEHGGTGPPSSICLTWSIVSSRVAVMTFGVM